MHAVNRRNAVTLAFRGSRWASASTRRQCIVGNIGSARRARFGVLGSGVNVASRIESLRRGWAGARVAVDSSTGCRLPPHRRAARGRAEGCAAVRSPCTRSAASSAIAAFAIEAAGSSRSVRRRAGCDSATASSRASTSASARTTRPSSGCPRPGMELATGGPPRRLRRGAAPPVSREPRRCARARDLR